MPDNRVDRVQMRRKIRRHFYFVIGQIPNPQHRIATTTQQLVTSGGVLHTKNRIAVCFFDGIPQLKTLAVEQVNIAIAGRHRNFFSTFAECQTAQTFCRKL